MKLSISRKPKFFHSFEAVSDSNLHYQFASRAFRVHKSSEFPPAAGIYCNLPLNPSFCISRKAGPNTMTLINKSLLGHFLCRYLQNLSPSAKVSDETSYFVQALNVERETNLNLWECDKLIASEASGPQKTLKMGLGGNFTFCGYGIIIMSLYARFLSRGLKAFWDFFLFNNIFAI